MDPRGISFLVVDRILDRVAVTVAGEFHISSLDHRILSSAMYRRVNEFHVVGHLVDSLVSLNSNRDLVLMD